LGEVSFQNKSRIKNFTSEEAQHMQEKIPLSHHDLYESIEKGEFPSWRLFVQVMLDEEAATYHINPFDVTKSVEPQGLPLLEIGKLVLNRYSTKLLC